MSTSLGTCTDCGCRPAVIALSIREAICWECDEGSVSPPKHTEAKVNVESAQPMQLKYDPTLLKLHKSWLERCAMLSASAIG